LSINYRTVQKLFLAGIGPPICSINGLNQLVSESKDLYTYDKNGNRTSKDEIIYSYDALNRLISLSIDGCITFYRYDSFGRRTECTSNGETVQYLYQFDTEIAAIANGHILEFKAIYEKFSPFAIELNDQIYAPIRNHRGDICALLDLQGNTISTYRYNAFGQVSFHGTMKSPWTFCGQRYDEQSTLYRFLNRDYDPFVGRWLTPDPLGFADGPNLYAYVNNNPLIYVDPYGLWADSIYKSVTDTFSNVWHSPRFHGGLQMLAGSAEMGAGMAVSAGTCGMAGPLGFAIGVHGSDHFCTGLNTMITGRYTDTVTSRLLQATGISSQTANAIDNGISMASIAGGVRAASTAVTTTFPQFYLPPSAFVPGIFSNRAVFEKYKTVLRSQMEKPYIFDSDLERIINSNYRPSAITGSGSTAAAIRHEIITGEKVCNKFHSQKGKNSITFLESWLKCNPTARQGDRAVNLPVFTQKDFMMIKTQKIEFFIEAFVYHQFSRIGKILYKLGKEELNHL
jgi:RHS repeat-associated protein